MQDSAPANKKSSLTLPELLRSEARVLLCYPTCQRAELVAEQAQKLGVVSVELSGNVLIGRYRVLGKGFVGMVVKARLSSDIYVAMKVRRTDAARPSMANEASYIELANKHQIGPKLYGFTQDVLLMELVEGTEVDDLIREETFEGAKDLVAMILEQCRVLDKIGLSHGELATLRKHIVVTKADLPVILDFESASMGRRPSNLTSAAQYLLVSGPTSARVRGMLRGLSREEVIQALREYKHEQNDASFQALLQRLRLTGRMIPG